MNVGQPSQKSGHKGQMNNTMIMSQNPNKIENNIRRSNESLVTQRKQGTS
jgi:hypothetical protein